MGNIGKNISMASRSLRPQLFVAFSLMSVIPILALLNLIFPSRFLRMPFDIVIGISVVIALLGFLLVKRIIDPIIKISSDMKVIASGEVSRKIDVCRDDEIGDLGVALKQMTQRIKDNMDELKIYGERTKNINVQINKQVVALNALLQISSLITKGENINEVFEITISRLVQVANSSEAFVIFKEPDGFKVMAQYGLSADVLNAVRLSVNGYIFKDIFSVKTHTKIDDQGSSGHEEVLKLFNVKNLLILPIPMHGDNVGLLGIGNCLDHFQYSQDDEEIVSIFVKQLAIALENDFLSRKVEDLEIKDVLTGLFNNRYIVARLDEEIMRAISHQQPCAFIVIRLTNLNDMNARFGALCVEDVLRKVAAVLQTCGDELDRMGRINDDEFAMVLPEKNKKRAQELARQIKEKIEFTFHGLEATRKPALLMSVVENPLDGADAASLMDRARKTLSA